MADKNIADALKQLDPSNDAHWTASKQPAVAAVKELHGEDVTREDIDAAAAGFTRDTAPGFFMSTATPGTKADGTVDDVKPGTDVDGKLDVPGASQQADGSTEPSDGAPTEGTEVDKEGRVVNQDDRLDPADDSQGSERIVDGRPATSTAQNPPASDAAQGETVPGVEQVQKPWENVVLSGDDRPVPVDSPEGQATVDDGRPEAKVDGQLLGDGVADDLPGINANGDVSGVRIPSVVYDPVDRADVITPGNDGDNVDTDGKPSGIPSTVSEGHFNLHPAPFNPEGSPRAASASELAASPRSDGASEDDGSSAGGEGGPSDDGEAEQPEVADATTRADEVTSLEADLRSREQAIADLRMTADKANTAWRDAENEADVVRNRIAALQPTNSSTRTSKDYLESRKRELAERGARQQSLRDAGVNLADVLKGVSKSPLDNAMGRKTSRGAARPVHPRR